ncbi:hypothetical protein NPIL_111861, partial [Nephila pilipes]
ASSSNYDAVLINSRSWANYDIPADTPGRYTHGVLEEADFGQPEQPAKSDPCFLLEILSALYESFLILFSI